MIVKVCFPGLQHQHLLGNYYMQILRSESSPSKTEPQPWVQEPVLLKLQGWLRDIAVKATAVNASYSKVQALDGQYQHHSRACGKCWVCMILHPLAQKVHFNKIGSDMYGYPTDLLLCTRSLGMCRKLSTTPARPPSFYCYPETLGKARISV